MVRGNNKATIFNDDQDRSKFLERLGENITEAKCSVYAWVLMSNHVHILFKSGKKGISAVMRKLLTWYAVYYNRRHKRTGHLFENRYKSILCEEDRYLLALIRYIHLNPLRAEMVKTLDELDSYPWCGHGVVMGKNECLWMDTAYVLLQFNDTKRKSRNAYRKFVGEGIPLGRSTELTGGGLIRSKGGWSSVVSARRRGDREEFDERILGSGDFINEIYREAEKKQMRQMKIRRAGKNIDTIIKEECTKSRVSVNELQGGSRRRTVSDMRAKIAKRSLDELGLAMAEIARHVGVNTSSITRTIAKMEKRGGDSYAP
jgi:REP element-mobilizing transposase RayT